MFKYHPDHAWVLMDGPEAVIGLSFYAQAHLGEIVFVDLPRPNGRTRAGQPLCGIESAKTTSEIIAPITGRVIAANSRLKADPGLVNLSPLDEGWIVRIEPENPAEWEFLMDQGGYEAYLVNLPTDDAQNGPSQ
jgi:glycine cleavage system H protein